MYRLFFLSLVLLAGCRNDTKIREAFSRRSGVVELPKSDVRLSGPLVIDGADGLTIAGNGARLQMRDSASAAIIIRNSKNVRLENFTLVGNREKNTNRVELPPSDQPMARWNQDNGILIENTQSVSLAKLTLREIFGYGILVNRSKGTKIEEVLVLDSGSLDAKDHNNATGGILFEEGCEDFEVRDSKLRNIRGNGVWTHSMLRSPRNQRGLIQANDFRHIGRDALQAGHATDLQIINNTGAFIGFPPEVVDVLHGAVPVALDTAGNVERTVYANNRFEEVNGKCVDLDGFHDGDVKSNECANRRGVDSYPHGHYAIVFNNSNPDMASRNVRITGNKMEGFRFGAVFVIGEGHEIRDNVFRRVNLIHCNDNKSFGCLYKAGEPDLLRSGIYLGSGAHRPAPARNNVIEGNVVEGYLMAEQCFGFAPGVTRQANRIGQNRCAGDSR